MLSMPRPTSIDARDNPIRPRRAAQLKQRHAGQINLYEANIHVSTLVDAAEPQCVPRVTCTARLRMLIAL
jgi:hypothetical protein